VPMFGELLPDGTVRGERFINQASIVKCPHFIMAPEHYRTDESCRCDDPSHMEMAAWGYIWDTEALRWTAPESEDDDELA